MSATFKDQQSREWTIAINIANVGLVERETGVSLYQVLDDKAKPLQELLENLPLFGTVVYLLCKRQADAKGVDDYGFAEAIAGDCLIAMSDAFMEALVDFFPDARRRAIIQKIVMSGKKAEQLAMSHLETQASKLDCDKIAQDAFTKMLSESSGSTPDPSE